MRKLWRTLKLKKDGLGMNGFVPSSTAVPQKDEKMDADFFNLQIENELTENV